MVDQSRITFPEHALGYSITPRALFQFQQPVEEELRKFASRKIGRAQARPVERSEAERVWTTTTTITSYILDPQFESLVLTVSAAVVAVIAALRRRRHVPEPEANAGISRTGSSVSIQSGSTSREVHTPPQAAVP